MDVSAVTAAQVEQAGSLLEHVLVELSAGSSERDVLTRAATLVADLVDADVVAVCEGGHVHGGVGLGQRFLPERGLARVVRDRGGSFAVPGLGRVRTSVVDVPELSGVQIVVGRVEDRGRGATTVRDEEERDTPTAWPLRPESETVALVTLVARVLGLVVLARHGDERERWLRQQGARGAAERNRLQQALRQREQVLTTSVRFQRAVSSRAPLPELLLQIAASSSELMGSRAVSLVLADPRSQMQMRVVASVGEPLLAGGTALAAAVALGGFGVAVGEGGMPAAAAVHINGRSVGALVVDTSVNGPLDAVGTTVLRAFAEHASMALSHADTVRAVEAASSDPLTKLPNRAALLAHLETALRVAESDGLGTAVLVVDLDDLKAVNDSLGHGAGDEVLVRVARRLRRCLRGDDVAARLGGDEFALVVRDHEPERAALRIAARVQADVATPFEVDGHTVSVATFIGIAMAQAGVSATDMLRRADIAMYRAKTAARTAPESRPVTAGRPPSAPVVVFEPDMQEADTLRRQLEADLQRAVAAAEFELVYQPIVHLTDGAVVGVEALLRWRHRTRGLLEPADFLAGVEESPVLDAVWRWVLRTACAQVVTWRAQVPDLSLTVNVSAQHVLGPGGGDDVRRALGDTGLDPAALVLDVPARLLAADPERLETGLRQLQASGARILLDDFGALSSVGDLLTADSLARLRQLPVDGLKLDRTLIDELDGAQAEEAVAAVRILCDLGAALDLGVVAEGVERTEQVVVLQDLGCTVAQGLLLGSPRPPAELGPELIVGALDPVEVLAVAPALVDAGPRTPEEIFRHEFVPMDVPSQGALSIPGLAPSPGPVAVPLRGLRPSDVRRLMDRSS
ncbi:MAG: putative bifunctional diguanylate cyclase/phosphodiesterase [Janthinobacterium lividum]